MPTQLHFISGLPRSGSTLLSALLRQNPRFYAGMTSPLASISAVVQGKMSGGEFAGFFDDAARAAMLRGLSDSYCGQMTFLQSAPLPNSGKLGLNTRGMKIMSAREMHELA